MTITPESLRAFIGGSESNPLYGDSDYTRAIAVATDYLARLDGCTFTETEQDEVILLKGALTITLGKQITGDTSSAVTEQPAISQVKDGDVTISYATTSSGSTSQTLTSQRTMWGNALSALIRDADDGAMVAYHDL